MNDFQADEKHPFSRGDKNEIPQEERDCFINISSLIINFNFIHLFFLSKKLRAKFEKVRGIWMLKKIESKIRKSEEIFVYQKID